MTKPGLRELKKQQVRDRISGVATLLFIERGFEAVSVSEIADRAGVSRMTVFNYFPRKEDMYLDRVPDLIEMITAAICGRADGEDPVAALRNLFLRLHDERHPLAGFANRMTAFWDVIMASPTLRARVREVVDELEDLITALFTEAGVPSARLTAALIVAGYRVAYVDAAGRMMAGEDAESFAAAQRALVARVFDSAAASVAAIRGV